MNNLLKNIGIWLVIGLVVLTVVKQFDSRQASKDTVAYSDFMEQARSIRLAELALDFARSHLQPGGDLVVKVFQGAGLDAFQRDARAHFAKTYLRKPKASRDRSREHYLVGKGFREAS